DRLLERDRRLRGAADLVDLVRGEVEVAGDLERERLAAQLGAELALGADDLVELLDDVHGHANRARLVGERAGDRLADPPRRVRGELEPLAVVELLGRADEADRPLLDQVEERQALVAVALGDRDDEAEVRLHHLLLGAVVAAFDPLRQLDLLRRGEQVDAADVLEEELERIGRDLLRLDLLGGGLVLFLRGPDDLDLEIVEGLVEVVDLAGVEVELVEGERDLVGGERSCLLAGLQERAGLVGLEYRHAGLDDRSLVTTHRSHPSRQGRQASRPLVFRQTPRPRPRHCARRSGRSPWAERLIFASAGLDPSELGEEPRRRGAERRPRAEAAGEPQLDARLLHLGEPEQAEPEVEPHGLALRVALRERAEERERARGVGLVEACDRRGDLRLRIGGRERGRRLELPLGRDLAAEALEGDAVEELPALTPGPREALQEWELLRLRQPVELGGRGEAW